LASNEGSNGSYKRGAYRGKRNDKNSLQRNIAELRNNVYQYGTRDQGDRFSRTTEAIAHYVRREYSKEMRLLVKNQKESAMTMLSHYMNDKGVHVTDEDKGQVILTSFMQKHMNVTCYKCGKKGH
jgi:hypothetical protein